MIELKNVSKYYNNNGLVNLGLRNIDLKLNKNEIVAIVGDSGSGKSTLLNVICGVDSYEDGEMYFKGNETSYFSQSDMDVYRKEHVGFIFQNYNIIDSFTVLENVMMPMILKGVKENEAEEKAKELIQRVGLSHRINNRGTKLSGGEKQRCVIARALASDCEILACDEPTGNLDSKSGKEIIEVIKEVAKDKLVLIVTHNYEEVADIATRKIKVADGTIVEDYVIKESLDDEKEEVIIGEDKIRRRDLFKMAFKNIKSTPRKTFFTFLVFLFISVIAFYLYLSCMASSQVSVFNPDVSFKNFEYNRLVIFNQDHSPIENTDYKNISGYCIENSYFEDVLVSLPVRDKTSNVYRNISFIYTPYSLSNELLIGTDILNRNDAYIILPKENVDKYSLVMTPFLDGSIILSKNHQIVGIGVSEYISQPAVIFGNDVSNEMISLAYQKEVTLNIKIDDEIKSIPRRDNLIVTHPTVYLPYKYQDLTDKMTYEFYLDDFYSIKKPSRIEVRYLYGDDNFFFAMPSNYEYEFNDVYEISIYADRPNEAKKELEELGYTVVRPSVDFTEVSQNQLLYIAYVAISTIIILVLGFVSYTILSRIYISKNKDYTVFRTLGVVKKKMSFIVFSELLIISLVASIIAYGSLYILYYAFDFDYLNVVTYNNLSISLLYYLVIFLFTSFVSHRFNKRLFKFTVQTSFKGEVVRND